jgi:hypothetical protein
MFPSAVTKSDTIGIVTGGTQYWWMARAYRFLHSFLAAVETL